jgi:hypothetical protein
MGAGLRMEYLENNQPKEFGEDLSLWSPLIYSSSIVPNQIHNVGMNFGNPLSKFQKQNTMHHLATSHILFTEQHSNFEVEEIPLETILEASDSSNFEIPGTISVAQPLYTQSSSPLYEKYQLRYWEVPSSVCTSYEKKGITRLYDWQVECLESSSQSFKSVIDP